MDNFRKRAVFVVLISVVSILLLWLTWTARYVLLLLFASCIGALILSTFTNWLRSWIPMRRGIAFAIVITNIGLMIALLISARGSLLLQQLGDLQSYIPSAVRQIHSRLQSETWVAGSLLKLKILSNWRAEPHSYFPAFAARCI